MKCSDYYYELLHIYAPLIRYNEKKRREDKKKGDTKECVEKK